MFLTVTNASGDMYTQNTFVILMVIQEVHLQIQVIKVIQTLQVEPIHQQGTTGLELV